MPNVIVGGNNPVANQGYDLTNNTTYIDLNNPITMDCKLIEVNIYWQYSTTTADARMIIFRDNGTEYVPVAHFDFPATHDSGLASYTIDIDVLENDLVAFYGLNYNSVPAKLDSGSSTAYTGDVSETTTLKSAWTPASYTLSIEVLKAGAISYQKSLVSNAKITTVNNQESILSDAKIKVEDNQESILSDSRIVIRESIVSDAKIKALSVQKSITSDTMISALINEQFATNFITRLTKNKLVQTVLNVIMGKTQSVFNTGLFTRIKTDNIINTNLCTSLVAYNSIQPKALGNIIVYKDAVELTDVDYSTLKIQFNLNRTPSEASFTLARHHDDFDKTILGVSSIISAQNKITIYDGTILLFTGYIIQIQANSSSDTVGIVAQDARCKISKLSMDLSYGGKREEGEWAVDYLGNSYWKDGLETKITTSQALDSIFTVIGANIAGHDTVDFGFVPEYSTQTSDCCSLLDSVINNAGNINWYIDENEYLRFQKVESGTLKTLPLSSVGSHRHIYDTIINDITMNRIYDNYYTAFNVHFGQLYNRKWIQNNISAGVSYPNSFRLFPETAIKDITHYGFQSNHFLGKWYCGQETTSIWSNVYDDMAVFGGAFIEDYSLYGWFTVQWLSQDEYTDIASVVVGSGTPKKDLYLTNYGKKTINMHWEEQPDPITGYHWLCEVYEDSYDYTAYALDVANFELNQNNKLITEATVSLILDAYEYYELTLKNLINISNTTSSNCYNNNNGFPLNVSSISIDCSTRIVTMNLTNYGKSAYQRSGDYMSNYQPASIRQIMNEKPIHMGAAKLILNF
jgi:hypothetical protein